MSFSAASPLAEQLDCFLSAAPDPSYTRPTTRYLSKRGLPANVIAADAAALRPQPPHWPLVALLMFMPMAVGCGVADKLLSPPTPALGILGWLAGAAGLAFSVLHLGQPTRAWRVFLGWRRSWLSREALVFGFWFPLATAYTAVRLDWVHLAPGLFRAMLAVVTVAFGTLGLVCSVMIYADTRRAFWRVANTAPRFFGSAVVLGLASALCAQCGPTGLGFQLAAAVIVKLAFEARALAPLHGPRDDPLTPARKSALLLAGPLATANSLRALAALVGGVALPLAIALRLAPAAVAWPALVFTLLGELAERYLFFRAVDAPKMPGLPSA